MTFLASLRARLRDPDAERAPFELRQEISFGIVALMEVFWLMPWIAGMIPGADKLGFFSLFLYVGSQILITLYLVRFLDSWGMWLNLRQAIIVGGVVLAVFLTVTVVFPDQQLGQIEYVGADSEIPRVMALPPLFSFSLTVIFLVWRGLRIALVIPTTTRVAFGMRLGILGFFGSALFFFFNAGDIVKACLPFFFFTGLFGISLSRTESLRVTWRQPVSFGSGWLGFMALAAAVVTFFGYLFASLLGALPPEHVSAVGRAILAVPIYAITLLMMPLFLLLESIITAVISGLNLQQLGDVLSEVGPSATQEAIEGIEQTEEATETFFDLLVRLFEALGGFQTCLAIFIVLIVVLLLIWTFRRIQRAESFGDEERDVLDSEGSGLGGMLRRGLDAFSNMLDAVSQFGIGRDLFIALTVRRIYVRMSKLGAKRGYPRAISETPYEYRFTLRGAYPTLCDEVGLITETYVRVRYGELPETEEALQEVLDAWDRLKSSPVNPE